jgi:hypothetical protein
MIWGVRRYQNKNGSLTDEGRKRYEERKKTAYSGKEYGIFKGKENDIIKKGSDIYRIANSNEKLDNKRKYVSLTFEDTSHYTESVDMLPIDSTKPISEYTYKSIKDLKVMNSFKAAETVVQKYGDLELNEAFKTVKTDYDVKKFLRENRNLRKLFDKNVDEISAYVKEKGYDAVIDLNDYSSADYPVVLINPKESIELIKEYEW